MNLFNFNLGFTKRIKRKLCLIVTCLLPLHIAYAEESLPSNNNEASNIKFVEEDVADCSISDGKLISIKNTDPKQTFQVWIDRWFMDVQTADHTKQVLPPNAVATPLGCSIARAGGKQHWTIYSIKAVE
ncbi:MAG: hypothetical protein HOO90_05030 [Methylotenera sp.]|uniref:hypothetical protein n=1 Tax=Methylotenera sp. TaxID=2051956 RepID=UPI0018504F5E|nr:hypothetical protein [Methylotenera sp.]NOU24880.1 hypothetical protein [Methylotenera sp.]